MSSCGLGALLKGTEAVLLRCAGTSPKYQNTTVHVLSALGLGPRTLGSSAQTVGLSCQLGR